MKNFKNYIIFFLLIGILSGYKSLEFKTFKAFLTSESELIIKGSSNVNNFQCQYDINELSDSIRINYSLVEDNLSFSKANLELKNLSFNCGNKGINKDFNKLLKTDEFPNIRIDLIKAERKFKDSEIMVMVDITICNISKSYNLSVQVNKRNKDILVCGSLPIDINDFKLEPPKKLLGIIKVSNKIIIDFSLAVTIE
jgi:YceI-like domain